MLRLLLPTLLLVLSPACVANKSEQPAPPPTTPVLTGTAELDPSLWNLAFDETGTYELAWRPEGGKVPRNEEFVVEALLLREGEPVSGARVALRGWMPDHEHGFVRQPLVTELGDGRFRIEGVLLHMRGNWQLFFDVEEGKDYATIGFDLVL